MIMVVYAFFAVLGALAFQHIAFLVQYGSIFEHLRNKLAWRAMEHFGHRTHPVYSKLYELIMCQVCMTTQLALWLWAAPLAVFYLANRYSLLVSVFAFTIIWFSQAALALAAYDLARLVGRGSDALVRAAQQLAEPGGKK